jgi:lipopolysaccharide export system protein LptA
VTSDNADKIKPANLARRFHVRIFAALGIPAVLGALVLAALPFHALAQSFGGAFEGMSNSKEPVQIEADRLEVQDEQGMAIFNGNVTVVQGTTILKTTNLKVWYVRDEKTDTPGGNVKKIEATGKVAVRSVDQRATADKAIVDMKEQIATLTGNVTVSQGNNILTGCHLRIDMATNAANLTPCKSETAAKGRVKMLFTPQSGSNEKKNGEGKGKKKDGAAPAAATTE